MRIATARTTIKKKQMTCRALIVFLLLLCLLFIVVHSECVYTVKSGDIFGKISERMGCGWLQRTGDLTEGFLIFLQLNRDILKTIPSENRLQIGDKLTGSGFFFLSFLCC